MTIQQQIEALSLKIAELAKQQSGLSRQLLTLMDELEALKKQAGSVQAKEPKVVEVKEVIAPPPVQRTPTPPAPKPKQQRSTLEEFIGGNLASKVGILITIIGIFIGAKYAIEHNLVKPSVRVIAGYVSGIVLIGIALRLRKKYEQYSSVLMGGGLAVLYFITYIAYSFYGMLPQLAAFGLMLLFTAGTVYAALMYNRIIIAHLGLIGAYAIPILLSDNSGRYAVLFTYIAIINAGILVLSFRKYWKSLFYVAFVFTWLIYSSWATFKYEDRHFSIAFIFLFIYFLLFYITFLAYKLIRKEQYSISDVMLLLSNAFMFYGVGYRLLSHQPETDQLLGVFTLANAVIHLVVSLIIRKLKLADKALFYLLLGLVIAFITITVPVQLNGNWVTLLWTAEAVFVFIVGRTQQRASYEKLAIVLIILSLMSLVDDWWIRTDTPFLNVTFATAIFVTLAQGAILFIHHKKKINNGAIHLQFYEYVLPCVFLLTAYFTFELELIDYLKTPEIEFCSILLYSMVFVALTAYINQQWIKSKLLGAGTLIAAVLSIFILLVNGFALLNSMDYPLLRYSLIAATAVLLILGNREANAFKLVYAVFIQITIVAILSFEYLNWSTNNNEYKLGLSILWSVYALGLVILGINKKKKHWRLTGICFFIITVIKLFMYDLNQTSTISKTLSFISLGVILLLVSYLYNRYKHVIMADDEES